MTNQKPEEPQDIQTRFEQFHHDNPNVYRKLVEYARAAKDAGKDTIGIKLLMERFRWYTDVETKGQESYKINNDFSSRYARLIAAQEPDLADIFRFRELQRMG